jgi:hypothetical protein
MTIHKQISYLYAFFGIFLIACGAVAIDVAGVQAKTALLTGGIGGVIALVAGHFLNRGKRWSFLMGAIEAGILTILLFWRTGTYFIRLLQLVQQGQETDTTQTAGMAFLLTTAMLVVALLTLAVSVMFARQVMSETK